MKLYRAKPFLVKAELQSGYGGTDCMFVWAECPVFSGFASRHQFEQMFEEVPYGECHNGPYSTCLGKTVYSGVIKLCVEEQCPMANEQQEKQDDNR